MSYRASRKAKKLWSAQAVAAKARKRQSGELRDPPIEIDPYIKITIERRSTGENVVIECLEGDRIDNYSVYCNGEHQGIQSITTLMRNLRKALPRFRRMEY
jgi:hypothetical protein